MVGSEPATGRPVTQTGRFFFDGRRSDVLKVAGENVSTVEVEAVLTAHPAVLEASVVGAARSRARRGTGRVSLSPPIRPSPPHDHQTCTGGAQDRLGKAKQPRDITLLDELPRTSVGKIRKFMLKESPEVTP